MSDFMFFRSYSETSTLHHPGRPPIVTTKSSLTIRGTFSPTSQPSTMSRTYDHSDPVARVMQRASTTHSRSGTSAHKGSASPSYVLSNFSFNGPFNARPSHQGSTSSRASSRSSRSPGDGIYRRDSGYSQGGGSVCMSERSSSTVHPGDSISQVSSRCSYPPMERARRGSMGSRSGSSSRSNSRAMTLYRGPRDESFFEEESSDDDYQPYCCKTGNHEWTAQEQPYSDERYGGGMRLRNVKPSWVQ